jgi:uncharacterized protein
MTFVKYNETEQTISNREMTDLASKFLLSIETRNWDLLRLILTKDCIWRWPGIDNNSGTAIGVESVIKEISQLAGRIFDLRLINILYGLNGLAISLNFYTGMSGKNVDKDLITVCNLRGDLISGINTYLSKAGGIEIS